MNMKPAKRSTGSSTEAPKNLKKAAGRKSVVKRDRMPNEVKTTLKQARKRKAEGGSSSLPKKVKSQDNWRPMTRACITALENIFDLSILATTAVKRKAKSNSQEHMNKIKKGFLAECLQLKVPPKSRNNLEYSSHQHQKEITKSGEGSKSLKSLEANLKSVVEALEKLEEQSETLQHECSVLTDQMEEEEARQFLELNGQTVLNLPPHRPNKDESTLKARMRLMIRDSDSEHIAQKLGKILQKSEISSDDQVLLLQAHKQADQLFGLSSSVPTP